MMGVPTHPCRSYCSARPSFSFPKALFETAHIPRSRATRCLDGDPSVPSTSMEWNGTGTVRVMQHATRHDHAATENTPTCLVPEQMPIILATERRHQPLVLESNVRARRHPLLVHPTFCSPGSEFILPHRLRWTLGRTASYVAFRDDTTSR